MNINKNISVWRGSSPPPTIYHIWLRDDLFYIYNGEQWEASSYTKKEIDNIIKNLDVSGIKLLQDRVVSLEDILNWSIN